MSGDPITRAERVVALKFEGCAEAWSDKHSGDNLAHHAVEALVEAGLLRAEADQAALDAADAAASGWHSTNNDFIEAMDALVDAVAARRAVQEAPK